MKSVKLSIHLSDHLFVSIKYLSIHLSITHHYMALFFCDSEGVRCEKELRRMIIDITYYHSNLYTQNKEDI